MILLAGAGGQLGRELAACLGVLGPLTLWTRQDVDFSGEDLEREISARKLPGLKAVVNAAAYTAVDKAESEPDVARRVNARAAGALAALAESRGAAIVHYSTDYVFDGAKSGPYVEEDPPAPLNVYGLTKLEGERAVSGAASRHVILRTSWVFSQTGACFPRTVYRLARERDTLDMDATQRGAPTSTELLAAATLVILRRILQGSPVWGLFHLTASGETTWHGFASRVVARAAELGLELRLRPEAITARTVPDLSRPAKRPLNSALSTAKIREAYGLTLPCWQYHADRFADGLRRQADLA
ncbi:MAG: dTDP-4-dehydrorhamnose reductase [Deltaproteobacteria bacterium]|nr:dTDP-4-dehydrorhamnose reductase [Deltaproteobacteria bacterium]